MSLATMFTTAFRTTLPTMHRSPLSKVLLSWVTYRTLAVSASLLSLIWRNNASIRRWAWGNRTRTGARSRTSARKLQSAEIQRENRFTQSATSWRHSRFPRGYDGHYFHQGESSSTQHMSGAFVSCLTWIQL